MPLTVFGDENPEVWRPMFICDHCQSQITDPCLANVLWDDATRTEQRTPERIWIIHKQCTGEFEQVREFEQRSWEGLDFFLLLLLGNTNFTIDKQIQAAGEMKIFSPFHAPKDKIQ